MPTPARFEHEAAFYARPEDHLRMCLAFVEEGLERGEPVMVALVPERGEALSTALGAAADAVQFVDMTELGRNPARIIPKWQQFLTDRGGSGPVRGIGEPAWPGRTSVEYAEAALHEGLLNLAFDNGQAWRLMCPYDLTGLPPEVLDEARRTHPVVHNEPDGSERFGGQEHTERAFSTLLPVPAHAQRVDFDRDELPLIRGLVVRIAQASGLSRGGDGEPRPGRSRGGDQQRRARQWSGCPVVLGRTRRRRGRGARRRVHRRSTGGATRAGPDAGGWPRGLDSQPAVRPGADPFE